MGIISIQSTHSIHAFSTASDEEFSNELVRNGGSRLEEVVFAVPGPGKRTAGFSGDLDRLALVFF